ncbi:MAG: hypothetical protein IJ168_09065 [Eubacterium sp.]|nr:hypothetical protein [Eubacterium sp.]
MANENNLIPNSQRTPNERRENARKAGIASGKARRAKKRRHESWKGLGGVNCRHRMFPFFPGICTPNPIHYDEAENERVYKATQRQRKLERDIRNLKKRKAAAEAIGDSETQELLDKKLERKYQEINAFCRANGLKRDYARELISEQVTKSRGYHSENDKNAPYSNATLESVVKKEYNEENIQQMVNDFQKQYAYAEKEHIMVLTRGGKLYNIAGSQYVVNPSEIIDDKDMIGAATVHNHPVPDGDTHADAFSIEDLVETVRLKTSPDYLITGDKKYMVEITDLTLDEDQIRELYDRATLRTFEKRIERLISDDYYRQLEIMRSLSELDKRVKFYELL